MIDRMSCQWSGNVPTTGCAAPADVRDATPAPAEAASSEVIWAVLSDVAKAKPESSKRMNLAGIDLVSLRLVVLCAETQSLSAAARCLNMSVSCASHRLNI